MCLRKLSIMHLIQFIEDAIDLGREVILTVYANGHMAKDKLAKRNLGIVEACFNQFKFSVLASYFRGTHQIDGVWHTSSIVSSSIDTLPFQFGIGDHRPYIVCFQVKIF